MNHPPSRSTFVPAIGMWCWLSLLLGSSSAIVLSCTSRSRETAEGAAPSAAATTGPQRTAGSPTLPTELSPRPSAEVAPDAPLVVGPAAAPAWDGPHLVVTRVATAIYSDANFDGRKLGYLRDGAKIAVANETVSTRNCKRGWHEVVGGGYVCANMGTLDPKDPALKFAMKQPDVEAVLPYVYARNVNHGTPLYKSVPTPEQMYGYEPYLEAAKKWREEQGAAAEERSAAAEERSAAPETVDVKQTNDVETADVARTREDPSASAISEADVGGRSATKKAKKARKARRKRNARNTSPTPLGPAVGASVQPFSANPPGDMVLAKQKPVAATDIIGDAVAPSASSQPPPEEAGKPWWQHEGENENLHEVTLEDMQAEADDVLSMRMMKGFYVAVDKTFRWNDRLWYKTTKGLVAPADRFSQIAGSSFKGVELESGKLSLPVGFVHGSIKKATLYELTNDQQPKPVGSVDRFGAVGLTGKTQTIGQTTYVETAAGTWLKESQVRVAKATDPSPDVGARERWLDVNVSSQTLVAYVGKKPVYVTLISSGKESKIKDKDHRTPRGEWRIREKHIATTMDGDGTLAGDLPYSIEDVPYVAYFHRSYAVHGAFWHSNYGVQMSHGCVNLSPLDAKWIFFFTDPQLPAGWHGVWSTETNPGSRVVIHE